LQVRISCWSLTWAAPGAQRYIYIYQHRHMYKSEYIHMHRHIYRCVSFFHAAGAYKLLVADLVGTWGVATSLLYYLGMTAHLYIYIHVCVTIAVYARIKEQLLSCRCLYIAELGLGLTRETQCF